MRNGQNKRMRGRNRNNNNNNRSHNPLTKVFESNGPDVKIRGTASHVAEKYIQLARDAQSSGDPVAAENYYQHAEHYFRLIAAAQEQFRQSPQYNPQGQNPGNEVVTGNDMRDGSGGNDMRDGTYDDDEGDDMGQPTGGEQPQFGTRDPQPYLPRDAQFSEDRQNQQPRQHHNNNNNNGGRQQNGGNDGDFNSLPSFITGGGGQPQQNPQEGQGGGYDNNERNSGNERYGFRRRRHRRGPGGPRNDNPGVQGAPHEGGDDTPPQG
jgi:hypothetical protein